MKHWFGVGDYSKPTFHSFKNKILQHAIRAQAVPTWNRNLPHEYPLVFLEVLDDFLFKRFAYSTGFSLSTNVLLDGETYLIHRRILQRSIDTAHASKTGHLQSWLRHHWIVPAQIRGIEIRFRSAPDCIHKATEAALKNGELKVFVSSFPDGVEPRWLNDDPPKWSARKLTHREHSQILNLKIALMNDISLLD